MKSFLTQPPGQFRATARRALSDVHMQEATDAATFRLLQGRLDGWRALPDAEELRERAHAIRMETVANLDRYVQWAGGHHSLLIITWDEDEGGTPAGGHIPTMLVGGPVAAGSRYGGRVDHYGLLRTTEEAYGLPALGTAGSRQPVTGIWR